MVGEEGSCGHVSLLKPCQAPHCAAQLLGAACDLCLSHASSWAWCARSGGVTHGGAVVGTAVHDDSVTEEVPEG